MTTPAQRDQSLCPLFGCSLLKLQGPPLHSQSGSPLRAGPLTLAHASAVATQVLVAPAWPGTGYDRS